MELGPRDLGAAGTQIGAEPSPYRLDYELDVGSGWITRRLSVRVATAIGERDLLLEHDGRGSWLLDGDAAPQLRGALDCDLGLSPLTNLMPVRRDALHERAGAAEIVVAWVSVPDLVVQASRQRYEHVRPGVVRFTDLGFARGVHGRAGARRRWARPGLSRARGPGLTRHSSCIERPTISFMISFDPP